MNETKAKILVVDDDLRLRQLLERYLSEQGFTVKAVPDAPGMDRALERELYDLIVLDLMLPGEDGLAICRRLRGTANPVSIIMLTAKGDEVDRIVGLEVGADDYLPKPFSPRELVARIHAVLRRQTAPPPPGAPAITEESVSFGKVRINLATRELERDEVVTLLTSGEFGLLRVLLGHPRQPMSRDKLMELARGREYEVFDRAIDVQISRLRKLVEEDPGKPRYIQTVWGFGYVFVPDGKKARMKLLPRSLLWRTFLFVALLMVLSVAAWFAIFSTYEREPRARQLAQTLVSVANLTRAALVSARPQARRELLRDLSDREGIHIYPADPTDRVEPLPDRAFLRRVEELAREQLGPNTRLTMEREGERALFVNFRIDDSDEGDYWLALPRERIDRVFPLGWLGWGVAALLLSLFGAWLIVFRITRPLKALEGAARKVGAGETPARLDEGGPTELATVAHAFNQMSADLAQIDQDRALILAGISHDLRTPLTRLRMGIEMAGDDGLREGMTADVEEMDKTIGQFLDFARSEGGEAQQDIDVAALLLDIATQYRRRGFKVELVAPVAVAPVPALFAALPVRPQALRRAVSNLVDNALRYAGSESLVELALDAAAGEFSIEVRDAGPGIPPQDVERMKRPFARLEAARTNAAGAGLGLAIVDRIARTHHGRLELLPRSGGGLVARIVLKTSRLPPAAS